MDALRGAIVSGSEIVTHYARKNFGHRSGVWVGFAAVRLSLSQTSSGWRLTENRAMLLCDEGSFQVHWLDGCRSISVAGSARGRDLDIAAANKCSAADCS